MEWNVLDWNTPAIEFYRRIGARPVRGWIPQQLSRRRTGRAGRKEQNNG